MRSTSEIYKDAQIIYHAKASKNKKVNNIVTKYDRKLKRTPGVPKPIFTELIHEIKDDECLQTRYRNLFNLLYSDNAVLIIS